MSKHESFIAENRPWLRVTDISIEEEEIEPGIDVFLLNMHVENIGNSVALQIRTAAELSKPKLMMFGNIEVEKFASRNNGNPSLWDGNFGVFPGDKKKIAVSLDELPVSGYLLVDIVYYSNITKIPLHTAFAINLSFQRNTIVDDSYVII